MTLKSKSEVSMNNYLSVLIIAAELLASAFAGFFLLIALAFAGESSRSKLLTPFGWAIGALYFIVALTPLVSSCWLLFRRFISTQDFPVLEGISSPYWVPVILLVGCIIFCVGLIAFQSGVGLTSTAP